MTRHLRLFLSALLLALGAVHAPLRAASPPVYQSDIPFVNVFTYGAKGDGTTSDNTALTKAATAAGSNNTLFLPGNKTFRIAENLTVTRDLLFAGGASFTVDNNRTLTISSQITAGLQQIFKGEGSITFTAAQKEYYPHWWGGLGSDLTGDQLAIQKAADAINTLGGGTLVFPKGNYYLYGNVTVPATVRLKSEPGALLKTTPDVTLTHLGPVDAGLSQWIDMSAGGTVSFAGNARIGRFYPQWWGAKGDGTANDSAALQSAAAAVQAAGGGTLDFGKATYRVTMGSLLSPNALASFSNLNGVRITGDGATIQTDDTFTLGQTGWSLFSFTSNTNVTIEGLTVKGVRAWPDTARQGIVAFRFDENNRNITIKAKTDGVAYGVWSGEFSTASKGDSRNFDVTLDAYDTGYSVACWESCHNSRITVNVERARRALYLAGARHVDAQVFVKDFHASAAVALTGNPVGDPATATEERWNEGVRVRVKDMGSTHNPNDGLSRYLVATNPSSGTGVGEGRNIDIGIDLTLTPASTKLYTGVGLLSWNFDNVYNPNLTITNMTISGVIDRSTAPADVAYHLIYSMGDSPGPKYKNLRVRDFSVKENTGVANTRGIFFWSSDLLSDVTWENVRGVTSLFRVQPPSNPAFRHVFVNCDTSVLSTLTGTSIAHIVKGNYTSLSQGFRTESVAAGDASAALYGTNAGTDNGSNGVVGTVTGAGTSNYGVKGVNSGASASGAGVVGISTNSTGVSGLSTSGIGVTATSGTNYGLYVNQTGASGGNPAVQIDRTGSGTGPLFRASLGGVPAFTVTNSGGVSIGGGPTITKHLSGTTVWDPANTINAAFASVTLTVTGAAVGDTVAVGFSQAVPAGAVLSGAVTGADTVTVSLCNFTGSDLNLTSGTLRADVWKH